MVSREEGEANVIDIVSIHQKIQHYHHLRNHDVLYSPVEMGALEEEEKENLEKKEDFVFDFYLVQALPLLTIYQQMIKDRGKIRFGPAAASTGLPRGGGSGASPTLPAKTLTDDHGDSDRGGTGSSEAFQCFRFPSVLTTDSNRKDRSPVDIIREYLSLVERYFPRLYEEMDMATLEKTVESPAGDLRLPRSSSSSSITDPRHPVSSTTTTTSFTAQEKECVHVSLIMSHENMLVCEKCGFTPEQNNVSTSISFKDINRVNLASKYLYDRITHFKDCINQFQGKQNCTIDKSVYDDLIRQFLLHDLIPEDYASLPKDVAFRRITKEHIMLFLKDCRHTKHYEDVVLIHSHFTGIQPPDVTHLENQLLHDFDQLTCLYDKKHRQQDRKNFINTQYVLYQLLKRHKYPCKKEDFNILKTIDRKFYHDDICKSLFEELHWNFNPTF
jgi:hypothetical protein